MRALTDADAAAAKAARRWAAAQAGASLSARQQRRLQAWLAADPKNRPALEASQQLLAKLGQLQGLGHYARLRPAPASPLQRLMLWWRQAGAAPVRPLLGAGLALAALALVVAGLGRVIAPAPQTYRTQVGQIRQIALSDGSRVDLGPASSLRVAFVHGRRQAWLDDGEAFFSVAKQHGAPFFVDAGEAVVRVVGTQFNVRHGDSQVRVAVREGVVQVASSGDAAHLLVLRPGQDVLASGGKLTPGHLDATLPGAWRAGRVYYEGATLREVAADARRYAPRAIVFTWPQASTLRVTASFRTGDFEQFLTSLESVLPVDVTTRGDGAILIGRATAAKGG